MLKNNPKRRLIFGCGDIGRRIVKHLIDIEDQPETSIYGYVHTSESAEKARSLGVNCDRIELDKEPLELSACHTAELYYTVAPQTSDVCDERSRRVIKALLKSHLKPSKVVLISTTGVYGDCNGEWVTEQSPTKPQTERGQRRLDAQEQWQRWGLSQGVAVVVLRVPGIYANSRLPRERLQRKTPVVRANECGFTNRIHADDLAGVCVAAMARGVGGEIYNVTDGTPGKIADYLQAAAQALNYEALPEISMNQAANQLSAGMLSYLNESRKISNQKMLKELGIKLRYPNFKEGLLK